MTAPHLTASDRRLAARASRPKHAVRWAIRPRAVLWDRNCRTRVGPAQRANNRRLAADYPVISRRSPGSRPPAIRPTAGPRRPAIEEAGGRQPLVWMFVKDRQPHFRYSEIIDEYRADVTVLKSLLPHRETGVLARMVTGIAVVEWRELVPRLPDTPELADVQTEIRRRTAYSSCQGRVAENGEAVWSDSVSVEGLGVSPPALRQVIADSLVHRRQAGGIHERDGTTTRSGHRGADGVCRKVHRVLPPREPAGKRGESRGRRGRVHRSFLGCAFTANKRPINAQ